jgi:hypothetical protein
MTVDQRASRRVGDKVADVLSLMGDRIDRTTTGVVRPFERTVGDEIQAVLSDAALAVDTALDLLRLGGWSVGIGAGAVDEPLPEEARAGSGEAFVLARSAVERAKGRGRPVPLAVVTATPQPGNDCEAVLTMLGSLFARRSEAGWAVIDAVRTAGSEVTQEDVARKLGITQQAVSQRLRAAMWQEEQAVRPVAARLLAEGDR